MSPLRVRYYHPAEKLRPYIGSYSFTDVVGDGPPFLLQPGWANLRFTLTGHSTMRLAGTEISSRDMPARIVGPTSRAYELAGFLLTRAVGVGLLPLGWAHFVGQPAHRFADRVEPLDVAFADRGEHLLGALREAADDEASRAILDAFFLRLHAARPAPPPYLIRAHELLLESEIATAEQVAARLGLSSRHVARLSLDMFGFTTKLLLRRQRFLRTLAAMRGRPHESWATLLDEIYYDQSHFVHDCYRFLGMSPSAFFARQRAFFHLVTGLRLQTIGQPLQGLHPVVEAL
jgi:AraC-like DNA-binding protein